MPSVICKKILSHCIKPITIGLFFCLPFRLVFAEVISSVSVNQTRFDPGRNQTVGIGYDLSREVNITMSIYEAGGDRIRTLLSSVSRNAGAHTEIWNGRDGNGTVVPEGAYKVIIQAYEGVSFVGGYYPPVLGAEYSNFTVAPGPVNPYNNELCRIEYTLGNASIVQLLAANPARSDLGIVDIVNMEPRERGTNVEFWNGQNSNSSVIPENVSFIMSVSQLPENVMIVKKGQLQINITTDPYYILTSHGEFTRINFTLPVNARINARIYQHGNVAVKTLLNETNKSAGTHTLEWDGTNSTGVRVPFDDYAVEIRAEESDGRITVRRGTVSIL